MKWILRLILVGTMLGVIGLWLGPKAVVYGPNTESWLSVEELRERINAKTLSERNEIFGNKNQKIGGAGTQRKVLRYDEIPQHARNAFIAAEDNTFWNHGGVDIPAIARCAFLNMKHRRIVCGGSTLTQQMVKRLLTGNDKTFFRKLDEAVMAVRMEKAVGKEAILALYVNEIFLGYNSKGLWRAAEQYFGKNAHQLTIAEYALIAGLPPAPSDYNPFSHKDEALTRRAYVLGRMRDEGFITPDEYAVASKESLNLRDRSLASTELKETHYVAHVLDLLKKIVDSKVLAAGGLKVYTGLDPKIQRQAMQALGDGIHGHSRRQVVWRTQRVNVDIHSKGKPLKWFAYWIKELTSGNARDGTLVWDFTSLANQKSPLRFPFPEFKNHMRTPTLHKGLLAGGVVIKVDAKTMVVSLGGAHVTIEKKGGYDWTKQLLDGKWKTYNANELVRVGDIVLVTVLKIGKTIDGVVMTTGRLEGDPIANGAVVVIDPKTHEVRAMVGGYGSGAGTLNRATYFKGQQPGSAFKPIVYAAAFQTGKYGTTSTCNNTARTVYTGIENVSIKLVPHWKNGDLTFLNALAHSENPCAVDVLRRKAGTTRSEGFDNVMAMAKAVGLKSTLNRNEGMALGNGEVTPLEMTNAYTTIASEGVYAEPIFIRKVVGADGTVIYSANRDTVQAVEPVVMHLTSKLLQEVIISGTGQRAKQLGCQLAGKTGTTNNSRDAWFLGFSPSLVVGVFVGRDDNEVLSPDPKERYLHGRANEQGALSALPVWIETMRGNCTADETFPTLDMHPSLKQVFIDLKSGGLVKEGDPRAVSGIYPLSAVPTSTAPTILESGDIIADPQRFGIDDY